MRKYIVLSTNDDPQYLFYTPLACYLWRKFGWEPIVFFRGDRSAKTDLAFSRCNVVYSLDAHEGYRDDTIAQVSRLYAGCLKDISPDDLLMTGDNDMIPLSDYWKAGPETITIYGHDLTGWGQFPICYISMTKSHWIQVMCLTKTDYNEMILRDMKEWPISLASTPWEQRWGYDQELITQRIKATQFPVNIIKRGQYSNGYAIGRVDRGVWSTDLDCFIDCHLHRDLHGALKPGAQALHVEKFSQTMRMLYKIWPDESWDWFLDYSKKFATI